MTLPGVAATTSIPPAHPVEVDPESTVDQKEAGSHRHGGRDVRDHFGWVFRSLPEQLEKDVSGQEDGDADQEHEIEDVALTEAEADISFL